LFDPERQGEFVSITGEFLHRVPRPPGNVIVLRNDGRTFDARLRYVSPDDLGHLRAGSQVRVTGVLWKNTSGESDTPSPRIIVGEPSGLEVLTPPPWPMRHTLTLVAVLAVALGIGLLALGIAHRRLRESNRRVAEAERDLRSLNSGLESRIQSRTAEIKAANELLQGEVAERKAAQAELVSREARYRMLVEHMDAIVWEFDGASERVTYISPQAARLGYAMEDWLEEGFWAEHIHPEDRAATVAFCMAKTSAGADHELQYRFLKADGGFVWFDDKVTVGTRKDGSRIFRGVLIDITQRRQGEDALRETEERFAKAFQSSPTITVITRQSDACFIDVNEQFTRTMGYARDEVVGKTSLDLNLWADTGRRDEIIDAIEHDRPVRDWECSFRCKAGDIHTMLLSIERINVRGVPCLLGIHFDVTARKKSEQLGHEQNRVLEMIAQGAPLGTTLDRLVLAIEAQAHGMFCSILLLDKDGQHLVHGAAPSLSEDYNRAVNGIAIGPEAGSCGTAAHRREPVVVEDVQLDPLWANFKAAAHEAGLRSCWSTPIFDSHQQLLGTFAIYYREPRLPNPEHMRLVEVATHTAAICIKSATDDAVLRANALTLSRSNELLQQMGQMAEIGAWSLDLASQELTWSEQVYVIHELDPRIKPDVATAIDFYAPEARPIIRAAVDAAMNEGTPWDLELPLITAKGRRHWVRAQGQAEFAGGKPVRLHGAFQDITARKHAESVQQSLEVQLRQSQKMEAIGTLAGGVAHDFNNILGAIMGCAELARMDSAGNPAVLENLDDLLKASHRAKDLVRQILTFSRQQNQERRVIQLQPVLHESLRLLRAALPASVELRPNIDDAAPPVFADAGLVQQIVMNLATNAAQAIGQRSGHVDISLARCVVDPILLRRHQDLRAGPCVRLQVRDDGVGMAPTILERIFEPFFTTKGPGQGTGLGLSVVHGIVRSHDGVILVDSKPGVGTTFDIYLPIARQPADQSVLPGGTVPGARGSERILLIDDEVSLLKVGEKILRNTGYDVTACTNPAEAVEIFRQSPSAFSLVITDYAMPGQNGAELARQIFAIRPGTRIVVCTGYTSDLTRDQALKLGFCDLLQKPVEMDTICRTVRQALDQPPSSRHQA
jgi:PAS domain S-box-containing protein